MAGSRLLLPGKGLQIRNRRRPSSPGETRPVSLTSVQPVRRALRSTAESASRERATGRTVRHMALRRGIPKRKAARTGGPPGFLQALDGQTLAFDDFKGNRQLITTSNLSAGDR